MKLLNGKEIEGLVMPQGKTDSWYQAYHRNLMSIHSLMSLYSKDGRAELVGEDDGEVVIKLDGNVVQSYTANEVVMGKWRGEL